MLSRVLKTILGKPALDLSDTPDPWQDQGARVQFVDLVSGRQSPLLLNRLQIEYNSRKLKPNQRQMCPTVRSISIPRAQRGHSAGTAPIITLFIPGTPLKTTPLEKDA